MDLQKNETKTETREKPTVLETATKWYKRWLKLPLILFISIIAFFFIWGIVDATAFTTYGWRGAETYGTMRLSSGFLCWFIWQLIGSFLGTICYFIVKLTTAPTILKVEYLKKISEK